MTGVVAVIRIRGDVGLSRKMKDTLKMLRLYKKNTCVVLKKNQSVIGMLDKVRDYVTWGEISKETFKLLLEKRGKLAGKKSLTLDYLKEKEIHIESFCDGFYSGHTKIKDIPGLKPFFRLSPPIKGFERKGVKKQFSIGGTVGYRKDKINDLISRMI